MSQTDDSSTTVSATDHPQVYYGSPAFHRGELEVASEIADELEDCWRVLITMGPYRGYNVQFDIKPDANVVHLDFYSVRPHGGEYDVADVIADIKEGIRSLS